MDMVVSPSVERKVPLSLLRSLENIEICDLRMIGVPSCEIGRRARRNAARRTRRWRSSRFGLRS